MISIIMPYLNEGSEPQLTFNSVRDTADGDLEVIAINDGGDETVNGAININNKERLGVGGCRNLGVSLAKSDNILIIDAHMRFRNGWYDRIIEEIESHPASIFCTSGCVDGWGAYMNMFGERNIIETKWIMSKQTGAIPVVLGGAFATNKKWFEYLRGYDGMSYWGTNEIYLSAKSWMAGGDCKIISDVIIEHKYRKQFPFTVLREQVNFNKLVVAYTLFPTELKRTCERHLSDHKRMDKTNKLLRKNAMKLNELRDYYSGFKYNIYKFLEVNDEYR